MVALKKLYDKSSFNKKELEKSELCGCFCCCKIYTFAEIKDWTDNKQTAICPYCDVDSVIPLDEITKNNKILKKLHSSYFC